MKEKSHDTNGEMVIVNTLNHSRSTYPGKFQITKMIFAAT